MTITTTTTKINRTIVRPTISKIQSDINKKEIENCIINFKIIYDNKKIVKKCYIKSIEDLLLKNLVHKFIHKIEESIKDSFLLDNECKKLMNIELEIEADTKKKFVYHVDANVTQKEMCKISSLVKKAYNESDIFKNNDIKELMNFENETALILLKLKDIK
jgi:hypothetical protein